MRHRRLSIIPPRSLTLLTLLTSLPLLSCGCGGNEPTHTAETPSIDFAYEESFGSGPVRLVLRLEKTEIKLSDRIVCEQELLIEPGFLAEFPEYLAEDFEGLAVVDIDYLDGAPPAVGDEIDEKTRAVASSRQRYRKRLTLEPNRSGDLAIAPLAVYFLEVDGETREHHFFSEETPVKVAGLGDLSDLSIREDHDIFEAPPLLIEDRRLFWATAGLGVLAIITATCLLLRRRGPHVTPPPPAHEIAYAALRRLVARNFVDSGEIELFFVHLSAILREYVENRFDVHAPERTTEEFLVEASRAEALARHRERLGEFLGICDQVKFALFQPATGVVQDSFDVVKQFIEETKSGGY